MSLRSLWKRYQDALATGSAPSGIARSWDGYPLWQRYWTGLLGFRLAPKNPGEAMPGKAVPLVPVPAAPGVLRLPRFDRAALRTAGTASLRRQSWATDAGGMRYVLRDAGRERLEVVAESGSDLVKPLVLPVTVTTPERSVDYLLLFAADESGSWVGAVHVPGFRDWADVSVHGLRELSSLDRADAPAVTRSVTATPDLWVPAWQAVARVREPGDPVREAIEKTLGP